MWGNNLHDSIGRAPSFRTFSAKCSNKNLPTETVPKWSNIGWVAPMWSNTTDPTGVAAGLSASIAQWNPQPIFSQVAKNYMLAKHYFYAYTGNGQVQATGTATCTPQPPGTPPLLGVPVPPNVYGLSPRDWAIPNTFTNLNIFWPQVATRTADAAGSAAGSAAAGRAWAAAAVAGEAAARPIIAAVPATAAITFADLLKIQVEDNVKRVLGANFANFEQACYLTILPQNSTDFTTFFGLKFRWNQANPMQPWGLDNPIYNWDGKFDSLKPFLANAEPRIDPLSTYNLALLANFILDRTWKDLQQDDINLPMPTIIKISKLNNECGGANRRGMGGAVNEWGRWPGNFIDNFTNIWVPPRWGFEPASTRTGEVDTRCGIAPRGAIAKTWAPSLTPGSGYYIPRLKYNSFRYHIIIVNKSRDGAPGPRTGSIIIKELMQPSISQVAAPPPAWNAQLPEVEIDAEKLYNHPEQSSILNYEKIYPRNTSRSGTGTKLLDLDLYWDSGFVVDPHPNVMRPGARGVLRKSSPSQTHIGLKKLLLRFEKYGSRDSDEWNLDTLMFMTIKPSAHGRSLAAFNALMARPWILRGDSWRLLFKTLEDAEAAEVPYTCYTWSDRPRINHTLNNLDPTFLFTRWPETESARVLEGLGLNDKSAEKWGKRNAVINVLERVSFELFLGNYNSPSDYWNNENKFPLPLSRRLVSYNTGRYIRGERYQMRSEDEHALPEALNMRDVMKCFPFQNSSETVQQNQKCKGQFFSDLNINPGSNLIHPSWPFPRQNPYINFNMLIGGTGSNSVKRKLNIWTKNTSKTGSGEPVPGMEYINDFPNFKTNKYPTAVVEVDGSVRNHRARLETGPYLPWGIPYYYNTVLNTITFNAVPDTTHFPVRSVALPAPIYWVTGGLELYLMNNYKKFDIPEIMRGNPRLTGAWATMSPFARAATGALWSFKDMNVTYPDTQPANKWPIISPPAATSPWNINFINTIMCYASSSVFDYQMADNLWEIAINYGRRIGMPTNICCTAEISCDRTPRQEPVGVGKRDAKLFFWNNNGARVPGTREQPPISNLVVSHPVDSSTPPWQMTSTILKKSLLISTWASAGGDTAPDPRCGGNSSAKGSQGLRSSLLGYSTLPDNRKWEHVYKCAGRSDHVAEGCTTFSAGGRSEANRSYIPSLNSLEGGGLTSELWYNRVGQSAQNTSDSLTYRPINKELIKEYFTPDNTYLGNVE